MSNSLVESHLHLVDRAVSHWFGTTRANNDGLLTRDDAWQAGAEGLMQAASTFDPAKGPFDPHAFNRIYGAIRDLARQNDPLTRIQRHQLREAREHNVMLASPVQVVSLDHLRENGFDPAQPEEEPPDDPSWVIPYMRRLPIRHQLILTMLIWEGITYGRVAEIMGVTESRVYQLKHNSIAILRTMISADQAAAA
jgi:RNA polymerase sigma factor (sigma-70 family)